MATEVSSLRLSIRLDGSDALVGVAAEGCDPIWGKVQGDLPEVLAQVPGLVERARERWREVPKYPTYARPATAAPSQPRAVQSSPKAARLPTGQPKSQEKLF